MRSAVSCLLSIASFGFPNVLSPTGEPRVMPIHPTGHTAGVTSVAISVDGKYVLTGYFAVMRTESRAWP